MKISDHCYFIAGLTTIPPWMVNSGLIVGKEKTLIVDTGYNYLSAKTIYGYAKAVAPDNEMIVINTEPHFDHIGGNCFFAELGVNIYGHKNINRTAEDLENSKKGYHESITNLMRREKNEEDLVFYKTSAVNPNIKIDSDTKFNLGELEAEIFLTPGHTKMNISIHVPKDDVLFCGDVIVADYFPNLEDGVKTDWEVWLNSLKKIEDKNSKIIVSGHGDVLKGEKLLLEIMRMRSILSSAIE